MMKKIQLYFLVLLSTLTLISCNDDDEFYNAVYLSIPNLAVIETPPSYAVNDNLNFDIGFSRYQTEPGYTNPLDIYTTSEAQSFGFSYYLELKTGTDQWTSVFPNEEEYRVGEIMYNPLTEVYEFYGTLPLTTAGEYRFKLGSAYNNAQKTNLISRNPANKTAVYITTNANNIDYEGYYYFTVTQ